ncbi:DNA polymerase III subunit epsilon [Panacagrimonas sp.]|uniref:DNA polymerase III subunit epsilon n=1 Tax=Panacagrimonas sp. TaxID=2480088 RepID=UPI003B5298DF
MRQLVLDTETTGLSVEQGHRVIEIGVLELVNRRPSGHHFHRFVNPQRAVDEGAMQVHGISNEFLADKPCFAEVAQELWDWLAGDELIIHNAPFDVGFLDLEFGLAGVGRPLAEACAITDTVLMARRLHPGQKASLDALCRRYEVDNSHRDLHGALLDARLLADVYLAMTGGQSTLSLDVGSGAAAGRMSWARLLGVEGRPLPVVQATDEEWAAHRERLRTIAKKGDLMWKTDLETLPPSSS